MIQVRRNSKQVGDAVAEFANGRDEMNLVEFPLALLSERAPAGVTTLEYRDEVYERGIAIQRHVTVAGTEKHGLPTAKDEDVLMGMKQLAKLQNEFSDPTVYFTRSQLIRLLGWDNSRWSYDRIALALERWRSVSITYKQAWRDNKEREWQDRSGFGLIDSYQIRDSRKAGKRTMAAEIAESSSWFRWNGFLFDSFRAGYLKKLNYRIYRKLGFQAAKRLYRYLDKHFYEPHRLRLDFDLHTLAFEHLGMSRNYDAAQIRRCMLPAIEELERIDFIEAVSPESRFTRLARGRWSVVFSKKSELNRRGRSVARRIPTPASMKPDSAPRDEAAEQRVQAFLASKSAEERERIEADALRSANPFFRATLDDKRAQQGPLFEVCRQLAIQQYVSQFVAGGEPAAKTTRASLRRLKP